MMEFLNTPGGITMDGESGSSCGVCLASMRPIIPARKTDAAGTGPMKINALASVAWIKTTVRDGRRTVRNKPKAKI